MVRFFIFISGIDLADTLQMEHFMQKKHEKYCRFVALKEQNKQI